MGANTEALMEGTALSPGLPSFGVLTMPWGEATSWLFPEHLGVAQCRQQHLEMLFPTQNMTKSIPLPLPREHRHSTAFPRHSGFVPSSLLSSPAVSAVPSEFFSFCSLPASFLGLLPHQNFLQQSPSSSSLSSPLLFLFSSLFSPLCRLGHAS